MTFSDALNVLSEDYAARDHMFTKQCTRLGYAYPFPACHVNIKERFAKLLGVEPCGMDTALSILYWGVITTRTTLRRLRWSWSGAHVR